MLASIVGDLYRDRATGFKRYWNGHPRVFNVTKEWKGEIRFKVSGGLTGDWANFRQAELSGDGTGIRAPSKVTASQRLHGIVRYLVKGSRRFDVFDILACPFCKGPVSVERQRTVIVCTPCRKHFPMQDNIPDMLKEVAMDWRPWDRGITSDQVQ